MITFEDLIGTYGERWVIISTIGGGWYAYRREPLVKAVAENWGLVNELYAPNLAELAERLRAETAAEPQWTTP